MESNHENIVWIVLLKLGKFNPSSADLDHAMMSRDTAPVLVVDGGHVASLVSVHDGAVCLNKMIT